jgi:hypothetical protein
MATVRHLGLFPKCLPLENPFASLNRDLKTINSVDASLMFYWRVKKWTATFTLPERIFDGGETILPEKEVTTTFERNERNEKYLVCGLISGGTEAQNWNIEDTHDTGAVQILALSPSWFNNSDPANQKIYWEAFISYTEISYRAGWILSSFESTDEGVYYVKADLAMANGVIFQFHCELFNDGIDDGGLYVPSLAVTEYWEYNPNDGGGPIYDSQTGEQLREFPN